MLLVFFLSGVDYLDLTPHVLDSTPHQNELTWRTCCCKCLTAETHASFSWEIPFTRVNPCLLAPTIRSSSDNCQTITNTTQEHNSGIQLFGHGRKKEGNTVGIAICVVTHNA